MQNDIYQNLPKIGPSYNTVDDKQEQVVKMIKTHEVQPHLVIRVN